MFFSTLNCSSSCLDFIPQPWNREVLPPEKLHVSPSLGEVDLFNGSPETEAFYFENKCA